MKSLKQIISSFLVKTLTPKSTVIDIKTYGHRFIDITVELPKKVNWTPGDKVQFLLITDELRSYTPYAFLEDKKTFKALIYHNQLGEGAFFLSDLRKGDRFKVLGPQKSLNIFDMADNCVFFADESSIGLAFALSVRTFSR